MRTKAKAIRSYLVCIPEGTDAARRFSGITACSSDGEVQCLILSTNKGRLKAQAARFCAEHKAPVGILAAPHRYPRPRHKLSQAYSIAKKFEGVHVVFFDDIAHSTEYQSMYAI